MQVSPFRAGVSKAPPPSPWPVRAACSAGLRVPVAHFAAAQPHGSALGLAHRHPLAGLDRVDPDLRHGAHLLQLPAPPGTRVTPGHGPQRHRGQSQRGDAEPGGPRLPGEAEASQSSGAGRTHVKLPRAGLGYRAAVARRGLRLRRVWEEPELTQPHLLSNFCCSSHDRWRSLAHAHRGWQRGEVTTILLCFCPPLKRPLPRDASTRYTRLPLCF